MKRNILAMAVAALFGRPAPMRSAFRDASANSFTFRMGAGFAGDVNRTHPAEIEAALISAAHPPTAYGQFTLIDGVTNAVRPFAVADQSDATDVLPFGLTVRPFPTQAATGGQFGAASFGAATPPITGIIDVLRNGAAMAVLNDVAAAPVKGGRVYIWCAATAGAHILGGIEAVFSAGNTARLDPRYTFNGPPDSNGVVELSCNI